MESVAVIDDEGQVRNLHIQVVQLQSGEVALESLGPEFCQIIATPQIGDVGEGDSIITQLPRKPPDCKIRLQIAEDVDSLAEPTDDGHVKCKLCNYTTDKKANWYKHRKCHLGLRPYKCDFCNYHATNTSNLKRHMQMHTDVRRFVCQLCRTKFRQKVHLDRHILVKHGERTVQCSLCDFTCFSIDPDLKRHLAKNHLVGDGTFIVRIYVCAECNYETKDRRDMNQHRKLHRNPEPKMFCQLCNYVTDLESRFYRHMMKHSGEKPFACQLCPYRGGQKEHLHLHMRKHHGAPPRKRGRPRKCPPAETSSAEVIPDGETSFVGEIGEQEETLDTDESVVNGLGGSGKSSLTTPITYAPGFAASQKLYPCTHCSMRFSKPLALFKHVRVQHEGASYANHDGQSELSCVLCEFKTTDKKLLLAHLRKHSLVPKSRRKHLFRCNTCKFSTSQFESYSNHMKEHGIDAGSEPTTADDESSELVDISNLKHDGDRDPSDDCVAALNTLHKSSGLNALQNIPSLDVGEVEAQVDSEGVMGQVDVQQLDAVMESEDVVDAAQVLEGSVLTAADATDFAYAMLAKGGLLTSLQSQMRQQQQQQRQHGDEDIMTVPLDSEQLIVSTYQAVESDDGSGHHVAQASVDGVLTHMTSEQDLSSLTTGDFIEINGQMYKIEVAPHLEDHW